MMFGRLLSGRLRPPTLGLRASQQRETTIVGAIRVTWEELTSAGHQLSAGAEGIMGELQRMQQRVGGLAGTWSGSAQAGFDQLFAQWSTASRQLQQALTGIAGLLAQTAEAYRQTEEAITRSFAR
jgi:WXG100 family type VII secretion target